jgi:hypothetical protein
VSAHGILVLIRFITNIVRRHLVRLWLRDPEYAWETPRQLQSRWDDLFKGVLPEKQVFPLEPRIRSASSGAGKNWTIQPKNY